MNTPVVLITGALTGIGRATALAFAQEGASRSSYPADATIAGRKIGRRTPHARCGGGILARRRAPRGRCARPGRQDRRALWPPGCGRQ